MSLKYLAVRHSHCNCGRLSSYSICAMPFGKNDDDFEAFSRDSDAAPNRCTAGIVINRAGDDEEFATPFLAEMLDVLFQPPTGPALRA